MDNKIWDLYSLAQKIIDKECLSKAYAYGHNTIEDCIDYVHRRMLLNKANVLKNYDESKSAEGTYLYKFVATKIIDFFNSAPQKNRVYLNEDSINDRPDEEIEFTDHSKIMEEIFAILKPKEKSYIIEFYLNELSAKEISNEYRVDTPKQVSKALESARNKVKRKLGYTLEDIL